MSEKSANQPAAAYSNSTQSRLPYNGSGIQHFNNQGMNMSTTNPLANLQNLKATLPASAHLDNDTGRQAYNSPLMVLPSGQTVPFNSFYGQHQAPSTDNGTQMPFLPTGIFPNFIGNSNMGATVGYGWPYGMTANMAAMGPARRCSWSSNEENISHQQLVAPQGQQDYYSGYPFMPATAGTQQYIAGPIQPMKCQDNKSYEMVNLDELVSRDPPIPHAVPALWTNQEELSLAKCLQNPEGITNVYIRGFMPDTTDSDLERWASRFGEIESCKAIIEQETGKCKGFGFVMYYSPAAAENCIRGFFHLGFQASYAQKSRNSRLKDLEDRNSTNIYCTGVPIDWNESDLAKHFLPYHAVSTKICRDAPSGVSKEVGFARFETREIAERVIKEFHSVLLDTDGVKLFLRFADTKAQKQLKQQSQERRNWRSREYSYSVEHTPSPTLTRLTNMNTLISPNGSYQSPAGTSNAFTPATSVSPADVQAQVQAAHKSATAAARSTAWPMQGSLQSITNTSNTRTNGSVTTTQAFVEAHPKRVSPASVVPENSEATKKTKTPSPKKVTIKIEPASGKENFTSTASSGK